MQLSALLADDGVRLIVIAALAALAVGGLAFAFVPSGGGDARKRLKMTDPKAKKAGFSLLGGPDPNEARVVETRRKIIDEGKKAKPGLGARLAQAGLDIGPIPFLAIFAVVGVVVGLGAAYVGAPLIAAAGVAAAIALFGPNMVVTKMIRKRQQAFLEAFPPALDVLVRGVQAGLPLNEGLKVIATELQPPVSEEIARMVAALNVGFSVEEAAGQLAERIPSSDVNFFRTVLIIQKQTGGNLAEALENISNILRERQKLKKKVWALSSEARMSAMIIGSLPLVVGGLVAFMKPQYIEVLYTVEIGQYMLGGAAVWMLFGVLIMRSMVKFDV